MCAWVKLKRRRQVNLGRDLWNCRSYLSPCYRLAVGMGHVANGLSSTDSDCNAHVLSEGQPCGSCSGLAFWAQSFQLSLGKHLHPKLPGSIISSSERFWPNRLCLFFFFFWSLSCFIYNRLLGTDRLIVFVISRWGAQVKPAVREAIEKSFLLLFLFFQQQWRRKRHRW